MPLVHSPFQPAPELPPTNTYNFLFGREVEDHVCQIDGVTGQTRKRTEFTQRALSAATSFAAPTDVGGLDIQPGEVVGVLSENCLDYVVLVHACLVITTPIAFFSTYSTIPELVYLLRTSKATRLFIQPSFLPNALRAAKIVGLRDDRIYILEGKTPSRMTSLQKMIDSVKKHAIPNVKPKPVDKSTLAYLVFSSGTSGLPKAVMISHANVNAGLYQFFAIATATAALMQPPPLPAGYLPSSLCFLPLFHSYGLFSFCFRSFLAPSLTVFMPKWDLDLALKVIPKYKVSSVALIPSIIYQMVHAPKKLAKADLSSIMMYSCGAAALPQELGANFLKYLPGQAKQLEGYGLSEATIAICSPPLPGLFKGIEPKPGSVGVLYPGLSARIIREDGSDAGYGEIGELWVKGNTIGLGYWQNEASTKETFLPDGWLRTGDRFRVDRDGTFWYEDRAKDTLKISGMQVSPAEIEQTLLAHPQKLVQDVTVAGVPGSRTSDEKLPRAWVVLSPQGAKLGKEKASEELQAWVTTQLSKYKWLRGGIQFVDEIPKSATGKVLRRVLVDKYVQSTGLSVSAKL